MAIHFKDDLDTLLRDLEYRGYRVHTVKRIAGDAGRSVDIHLENGVMVRWDAPSQTVWAEGSYVGMQRVEAYLRRLYEGGWFSRLFATGYSGPASKRSAAARVRGMSAAAKS